METTKQRYWFAASSFSRMYTVPKVTSDMLKFCEQWAKSEEHAPLDSLHNVDLYFKEKWYNSFTGH